MIQQLLETLSLELTIILTASLPIIELRGAIPIGISLGLSPVHATILSFIGSMLPVPFILFSVRPIFKYLKETKLFNKLISSITDKSLNKSERIQRYGIWGLFLFVALPLPGTGIWTGSLAASLLDIRFKWAFPTIFIGNLIAGFIIMSLSHGVSNVLEVL